MLFAAVLLLPFAASAQSTGSSDASNHAVSGIVSEAASGEAIIGINVILATDSAASRSASIVRGARTNKFGFYSLPNIPDGSYFLIVRGIGYRLYGKRITVQGGGLRENIALEVQSSRSEEVTVQAEREATSVRTISTVEVKSDMIRKLPTLLGEADVFRVLQLMPGIKGGSELSSGLYVRGGSPDQNLTLLDGVIVYNPSHLLGFFSTFNNDALRDVRVMKGSFPAEYGGRLSSVIDLTMKEGTKEKLSGVANLGLIASRLTLEGPITENVTFMLSGRRTYLDLLVSAATNGKPPATYNFYDLNAKVNVRLSDNDRIYASGYFGSDEGALFPQQNNNTDIGINWGNATANLRWAHIFSDDLFSNFSAIYTDYRFGTRIYSATDRDTTGFLTQSQIRDFTLRGDVQWHPAKGHTVKAGFDATFHQFKIALESNNAQLRQFLDFLNLKSNTIDALEAAAYVQDEWEISPELTANIGFRASYFLLGNRLLPEPRISFAYAPIEELSIKGGVAVANQFLHLVINNGIALPTDSWFPSTDKILPGNSVQYTLGVENSFLGKEYFVSVEGYYKSLRNLYEFKDDANFTFLTPAENQLTRGDGEAYGVEVFINKRLGALTGWIGYTLSWTRRTFADLNDGRPFYPRYDRRHDLSVVATYRISEGWEVGAAWVYATGQAFTMPSGQFLFTGTPGLPSATSGGFGGGFTNRYSDFTERNGSTLPPTHRLDVNLKHHFSWFNLPFTFDISIYNVYSRWNPIARIVQYQNLRPNFGSGAPPASDLVSAPKVTDYALFGIVPTLGIGFKF